MKIEIGCGHDPTAGYDVYIDAAPLKHVTHVLNFAVDGYKGFQDNVADQILAIHFLEHLPRNKQDFFFGQSRRILKPGGKLEVHVPNLETICRAYAFWRDKNDFNNLEDALFTMIFGAGDGAFDRHQVAYNWQTLEKIFHRNGFRNVKNLTGIKQDRHTVGWEWVRQQIISNGGQCPQFSLIMEGEK